MHPTLKITLVLGLCLLLPIDTIAKESKKSIQLTCRAKHLDTNEYVEVKTVSSIIRKKIATAQWPLGYPTIAIDDSAFLKLPTNARQFIYYHECAHLKFKIKNEFEADCKSLKLINEKQKLTEIEARELVKTLVKEFGMSRRWSELLQCEEFYNGF